jgi:hypothetical protein
MIEISDKDAEELIDMLSLLAYYIDKDERGAKAIAVHAEAMARKLLKKWSALPE